MRQDAGVDGDAQRIVAAATAGSSWARTTSAAPWCASWTAAA
ncbi:MAG TPA: hypothetical protein VL334_14525 [Anaerolineae bacterium]|nr:hypothetical protein [Anaerolineae bacterium]